MSVMLNRSSEQEDRKSFDEALRLEALSEEEKLSLQLKKEVLAVLKGKMTARDLLGAITGLQEIAGDLAKELAAASRTAAAVHSCGGKCDYEDTCELSIPPCILAEAGIPFNSALLTYVEDGAIVIRGEAFPDEITGELLRLLEDAGVDSEGLSTLLKGERIVYGE